MGNQDRRLREYRNARNDGFKLAVSVIAESDLDDETRDAALSVLHKELRYREKLGIDTNLTMKELEIVSEPFLPEIKFIFLFGCLYCMMNLISGRKDSIRPWIDLNRYMKP